MLQHSSGVTGWKCGAARLDKREALGRGGAQTLGGELLTLRNLYVGLLPESDLTSMPSPTGYLVLLSDQGVSPPSSLRQQCVLSQLFISKPRSFQSTSPISKDFHCYSEQKASTTFWALGRSRCTGRGGAEGRKVLPVLPFLDSGSGWRHQAQLVYCLEHTHTIVNATMCKCPPQKGHSPVCKWIFKGGSSHVLWHRGM